MSFFSQVKFDRFLPVIAVSLAVTTSACTQGGEENGSSSEGSYVSNLKLRLSLQNNSATPESVRKDLDDGADPKLVYEGANLLIMAVNIKQDFNINDIDIDPENREKTFISIGNVQGDAIFVRPKNPENIAKVCEVLIKAGADVKFVENTGGTPLAYAMRYCQTPAAKVFLAAGADPNLAPTPPGENEGISPLGSAVGYECPEAIMLLLNAGATVNPNEPIYRDFKKVGPLLEVANTSPKLAGTPALAALQKAAASNGGEEDLGN